MKTMREGLGRMWRENPLIVILLLIGTALYIWYMATGRHVTGGRYDTLLQTLLSGDVGGMTFYFGDEVMTDDVQAALGG